MALTRKFLSALGIEADKVDEIIAAHAETVNALKEERDGYKADAEKLPNVQKELDDLKATGGDWQTKYENEHTALENLKNEIAVGKTKSAKEAAYKALLKEAGVSEQIFDGATRLAKLDAYELDGNGGLKDKDAIVESIKSEWGSFIKSTGSEKKPPEEPPTGQLSGKQAYEALSLAKKMEYANAHPDEVAEYLK